MNELFIIHILASKLSCRLSKIKWQKSDSYYWQEVPFSQWRAAQIFFAIHMQLVNTHCPLPERTPYWQTRRPWFAIFSSYSCRPYLLRIAAIRDWRSWRLRKQQQAIEMCKRKQIIWSDVTGRLSHYGERSHAHRHKRTHTLPCILLSD